MITHAAMILEDRVRLKSLTRPLQSKLENAGFKLEPDGYGHPSLRFNPEEEGSLESLLIWLAQNGVAFEADPKDLASPAAIMRQIKEKKAYSKPFKICSFDGDSWLYSEG